MKRTVLLAHICLIVMIAAVSGIVGFSIGSKSNIETDLREDATIQEDAHAEEDAETYIVPVQEDANINIENDLVTNAIMNEETALKVGRAILEEHFPNIMLTDDKPLEARERNGVWHVETTYAKRGVNEEGNPWSARGSFWYVEFSKKNGEIFYIGIDRELDEHTVIAPTIPMVFDFAELSGYGFPQGNWSINQLMDKYGTPEIKMESYWNEQWYEAVTIEAIFQGMTVRFRPLIDSGFSFYNVGEPIQNINLEEFDLTENDKNIETKVFNLTLHKENQGFLYGIKIGQSTKTEVIAAYP